MQRRNNNKTILEEKVDRGHLTDLLCSTESYEILCLLACGGPHKVDLTKLASDEFNLPRLLKDTLDDIREKYNKMDKSCLYTIGLQVSNYNNSLNYKKEFGNKKIIIDFFLAI